MSWVGLSKTNWMLSSIWQPWELVWYKGTLYQYLNSHYNIKIFKMRIRICGKIVIMFNTLKPRQNGCHFPDNIFKCIFLNENVWILIKIWLKFVSKDPINKIPALVEIMTWCRPGNKPLSEPMMVRLLMHIYIMRPRWVKWFQEPVPFSLSLLYIISMYIGIN